MRTGVICPLLIAALSAAAPRRIVAESDPLADGNAAYRAGNYEDAIAIYESAESRDDYLTRKFNAGVSALKAGKVEDALARFEEVSTRDRGELQRRAHYNLGFCHFRMGMAKAEVRGETDDVDKRIEQLLDAARSLRSAVSFYRKVEPPDDDSDHNVAVAKTALIAVVDEVARLEEEKKRKEEEEALKNPSELLRALIAKEKLHRGLSRALAKERGGRGRVAVRRLRKAEAENRILTEKLLHYLEKGPEEDSPDPNGAQQPSEAEIERRKQAAEPVRRAIEAQKQAEVEYSNRAPAEATKHHSTAISELRTARTFLPIDLPALIGESIQVQEAVLQGSKAVEVEQTGGLAGEVKGSGFGKMIVDALKDKVLKPLAKKLAPSREEELGQLAEDEEDVVWAAGILKQAEIPPTPPSPEAGAVPGVPPGGAGPPGLDEEEAKALSEAIRKEGATVEEEAIEARDSLAAGDVEKAVPPEEEALAALLRIADLLPKPPESPEEKLRKLIERQKGAGNAAEGMTELEGEALSSASRELSEAQREDGPAAGEIAKELEARQDERAQRATPKVREGEEHIFASAETLARKQPREGKESIDKAIQSLEEALAILAGQDGDQQQGQDQKDQQQKDQKNQEQKKKDRNQGGYALTPRQARMLREEMDRKRREEEEKLFSASSSVTVDKDW